MIYNYIFHCKLFDGAERTRVVGEDAVIAHAHNDELAHKNAVSSFEKLLKHKGVTSKIDRELMELTLVSKTQIPGTSEYDRAYRWQ
jgi:hypothetical protein